MAISTQAIRAGRAFIELVTEDRKLIRGLNNAQGYVRAFAAVVGRDLKQMAASATRLAGKLSGAGGKALFGGLTAAAPLALASKILASYADQISLVRAVAKGTKEELDELDRTAKRLGSTTSFTAGQVAELMIELGRGGMAAAEINAATQGVLDLSRATATATGTTAGIVVSSLRAFNLQADQATRVADVLTAAANGSFNTLEKLGEAFTYAGITAAQAGMSIEETAAILMALGNVGIQGSMAGTTLRRLLTINAAEADRLRELFGVEFRDAAGNARNLVEVFGEIDMALEGLGSGERAAKMNEAFGLLGITGAQVIAQGTDEIRRFQVELEKAGGTARRTAEQMDNNLGGSFRMLLSAAEGLAIAVGEALSKNLRAAADWITRNTQAAAEWVQQNGDLIVGIGKLITGVIGLGAALKVAGVIIASVAGGIRLVIGAFKLLGGTLSLLIAHPVIAGIALIGAALAALSLDYEKASQQAKEFADKQRQVLEAGDKARAEHQKLFARLKELSAQQIKTNAQHDEANEIIRTLTRSYGNLGLSIDRVTGSVNGLTEAERDMLEQQKRSRIHQLRQQEASLLLKEREMVRNANKIGTGVGGFFRIVGSDLGIVDDPATKHFAAMDEANEVARQRREIQAEINGLVSGEAEAVAKATQARQAENAALDRKAQLLKEQEATAKRLNEAIEDAEARLTLEGGDLQRRLLELSGQREREQLGETADPALLARKQQLDRELLERDLAASAQQAAEREAAAASQAERDLREAIAEANAKLRLHGHALERRLLEIRQERERENLAPGVNRELLNMKQRLERLQLDRGAIAQRISESRVTFSGTAAARGLMDAGGPADNIERLLERLLRKQDELVAAVKEAAPKAL